MAKWTTEDMPALAGRVVVVTGANSGLGLEATRALAAHGATVVMACRSPERAAAAAAAVRAQVPDAKLELRRLDLASLDSVAAFAAEVRQAWPAVDVLMNNAGIMAAPKASTVDGFEVQFGTNHLGHFALTLQLLPALEAAPAARVVVVSSSAHYYGRIDFDDLAGEHSRSAWLRYGQAKLANLLFTFELERRLRAAGMTSRALAAHPGYSATNLLHAPSRSRFEAWLFTLGDRLVAMPAAQGVLPQLRAATDALARGGEYYGPGAWFGFRGWPRPVKPSARARDEGVARRLWDVSEALTHVSFPAG